MQSICIVLSGFKLSGSVTCFLSALALHCCVLLTQVSILGLLLASFERYLCIIHPFVNQRYQQSYIWCIVSIIIWIFAISATVLHYFEYMGGLVLHVSFVLVCICVAFIYIKIYYAAMKVRKHCATVGNVQQIARPQAANMIAALVVLSIVCYGPFTYYMLATTYDNSIYFDPLVVNWLWCLLALNTVLNPIYYCILNKTLRRKFLRMLWPNQVRSI